MADRAETTSPSRMRTVVNRVLGGLYLSLALVLWGGAAMRYDFFPKNWLNLAFAAIEDTGKTIDLLWETNVERLHPHEIAWPAGAPPLAEIASRISRDEMTLVEAFRDGFFGLFLVNGAGEIEYAWRIPDEVFEAAQPHGAGVLRNDYKSTHGSHLFGDGSVVFTLDYHGVIELNRCSRPAWVLDGEYHHALFVEPSGDIWAPYREIIREPMAEHPWLTPPFALESVVRITPDGEPQESYSLLDAAVAGGRFEGLLLQGEESEPRTVVSDITHLNDVEIIGDDFAAANPQFSVGDIIVSLRTLDTVAVIDRKTGKFKFALSGMMLRQHDPDALPNGNLLIFDNRTGKSQHNSVRYLPEGQGFGGSRLIEINPRTQEIVWSYEGDAAHPFFTSIQGKLEGLANGDVLAVETEGGRVFQVSRATGDIVWQFNNLIGEKNGAPVYGRVTGATRYARDDLPFLTEPPCAAAD